MLLQRLLYMTDLPFCKAGTAYDSVEDYPFGSRVERAALLENEDRLMARMIQVFYHWQDWRSACVDRMVEKTGCAREEVEPHSDSCSFSIAHGIDADAFHYAPEIQLVPPGMEDIVDAHRYCVADCDMSLCSILCGNVNWDHFEQAGRHIAMYVDDYDVFECCPYMPACRTIAQVDNSEHFAYVQLDSAHGTLGTLRIAKSTIAIEEDRTANLLNDASSKEKRGIPHDRVELRRQARRQLRPHRRRAAPRRALRLRRAPRRRHPDPLRPARLRHGVGPLFPGGRGDPQRVHRVQQARRDASEQQQQAQRPHHGQLDPRRGRRVRQGQPAGQAGRDLLPARRRRPHGAAHAREGVRAGELAGGRPLRRAPSRQVRRYELVGRAHRRARHQPDRGIDINKTKLQAKSNGPSIQLLYREVAKHMIMFCLANTLRQKSLGRLAKMNADPDRTASTFSRRERTVQEPEMPTAIVPRTPMMYERMSVLEWAEHVTKNFSGSSEIVYKDGNKQGWSCRLEAKRNDNTRVDFYFKHASYIDLLPGTAMKQLRLFRRSGFVAQSRPSGLSNSFKSRATSAALLMPPPLTARRAPRPPRVRGPGGGVRTRAGFAAQRRSPPPPSCWSRSGTSTLRPSAARSWPSGPATSPTPTSSPPSRSTSSSRTRTYRPPRPRSAPELIHKAALVPAMSYISDGSSRGRARRRQDV